MAKPHCLNCIQRKKTNEMAAISEFLEGVKTPDDIN
jgi:hypothetical protein